jgi:hypothetical protein
MDAQERRCTGSKGRKYALAFSTLPPSVAVVCRGRMDAQERRCNGRKSLENLFQTFSTDYIRIVVLHFLHFRHPWRSYASDVERAKAAI